MYDDDIYDKFLWCDAFVVFSPIHWYSLTSQVKAMFDRLVCANLTLSVEDAKKVLGKNGTKNSEITGEFNINKKWDHLLKNHLEGKYGAFFVHGDNGADDYKDKEYPKSFDKLEERLYENCLINTIKPYIFQLKYSGINVPDEFIEVFHMNQGLSYREANLTLDKNIYPFELSEKLLEKIIDKLT